jgi:uncharacterized protein YbdZ (MbtH family)
LIDFKEVMMGLYDPDKEDTAIYEVVVNHEEQYSIWLDYKEAPLGWKSVGKSGYQSANAQRRRASGPGVGSFFLSRFGLFYAAIAPRREAGLLLIQS